jgi:hypothetical protein
MKLILQPWQFQHKLYIFRNVWNIQLFVYLQRSKLCEGKYWIFNKLYFSMKNSKTINYATNICWICQDPIVAPYVFTSTSIYDGRLFVCLFCFVLIRSTEGGCFKSCSPGGGLHGLDVQKLLNIEWFLCRRLN